MSQLYSPYDTSTLFTLEGDDWKYLDLYGTSGTYDAAMMAVGYDDSAWSTAPQPFVATPDYDDRYAGSTWDDFGIEYGPNGFIPTGYTSPNSHRWAGTEVAGGVGVVDDFFVFAEIVARTHFTIPAGIPSPFDEASFWSYIAVWDGILDIWIDGIRTDSVTSGSMIGSGRAGRHIHAATGFMPDSVVAPGSHLLSYHARGNRAGRFLSSVLMAVPYNVPLPTLVPPVRQRQIPGQVRQRQSGSVVRQRQVPR
jgi:hypothetical protein